MSRFIYEGERIPFGYGFTRYRYDRDCYEYAVMPLNWIDRLVWWACRKSQRPLTDAEIANHARFRRANSGEDIRSYNRGYEAGFVAGGDSFARRLTAQLDGDRDGS